MLYQLAEAGAGGVGGAGPFGFLTPSGEGSAAVAPPEASDAAPYGDEAARAATFKGEMWCRGERARPWPWDQSGANRTRAVKGF